MTAGYNPQIDDYVVWENDIGHRHEGWVYFKTEKTPPKKGWRTPCEYITIEINTKLKKECKYEKNNPHKKIHTLLLCYETHWHELQLIKRRKNRFDNTVIWTAEKGDLPV